MIPIIYSDIYLKHNSKVPHVENPTRLKKVINILQNYPFIKPLKINEEELLNIHTKDYVDLVKLSSMNEEWLDTDTYTNSETFETALYALGGTLKAMEEGGFALVRPPGHHAGVNGPALGAPTLGFCIFNNIAYAVKKSNARRVAIIDFDVHYGNGTQEIFWNEPNVLHIDIHQDPSTLYPGVGFYDMIGGKEAEGTKVNLIIPPLGADDLYLELMPIIQSIIDDFKPDLIAYSAGFDAYANDGLADIFATEITFYNLGLLSKGYRRFAVLEGGYSKGLEYGLIAFLKGLEGTAEDYKLVKSRDAVRSKFSNYLELEKFILRNYWKL